MFHICGNELGQNSKWRHKALILQRKWYLEKKKVKKVSKNWPSHAFIVIVHKNLCSDLFVWNTESLETFRTWLLLVLFTKYFTRTASVCFSSTVLLLMSSITFRSIRLSRFNKWNFYEGSVNRSKCFHHIV